MNIRKTILAAAIAVAAGQACAASTMASPVAFSAQEKARLIATLNGERGKHGLDTDHGFVLAAQHPGANGQAILQTHSISVREADTIERVVADQVKRREQER